MAALRVGKERRPVFQPHSRLDAASFDIVHAPPETAAERCNQQHELVCTNKRRHPWSPTLTYGNDSEVSRSSYVSSLLFFNRSGGRAGR
jgi:hypothetical protein